MKAYLKVLAIDAFLLAALYYVVADIEWRVADAATAHGHTSGYSSTFAYSIFTKVFTMSGGGAVLSSPPTLDWLQFIGLLLAIANGWYLYSRFSHRRRPMPAVAPTPPAAQSV